MFRCAGVALICAAWCPLATAADRQCGLPYKNLTDAWRSVANDCSAYNGPSEDCNNGAGGPGGNIMGDTFLADVNCVGARQATGVGDGGWYRFGGAGGNALALRPPGYQHCGTETAVWLSGWNASGGAGATPPKGYSEPGRYPAATEGVVEMTACHDESFPGQKEQCYFHVLVSVVQCDGFLLWQLPYSGGCFAAYCTASASGPPPPPACLANGCVPSNIPKRDAKKHCCSTKKSHKAPHCKGSHYECVGPPAPPAPPAPPVAAPAAVA